MTDGPAKEPFDIPTKDYTNGFHLTKENLQEKRMEIYENIFYLINMLKQIDIVYERGDEVMTEDEVRQYLKVDSVDPRMGVPKDIPKIRLGVGYVYYRKDVKHFLDSRRRGGK